MAPVREMPEVTRNKMSFRSRHVDPRKTAYFAHQKLNIELF
jgi:hypothetical protein